MTEDKRTPIQKLVSKSKYAYLILPVPSINYYENRLKPILNELKENERATVEFGERDTGYLEVKTWVGEKDFTTDWDVFIQQCRKNEDLEKEIKRLKDQIQENKEIVQRACLILEDKE